MNSEVTVLNEIVQEHRAHIAQLVSQVEDLKLQFDLVLNERNEAMDESASAKCVHEALVRNLTSMSEFAGKVLRERDEARAEAKRLRDQLAAADVERRVAVAAVSEDVDKARAERDEARREICEERGYTVGAAHLEAARRGWDCYREVP